MSIETSSSSMTTISPNRKRFRSRSRFLIVGGGLFVILLLIILARGTFASVMWSVLKPLSQAQTSSTASLGNFFATFSSNHSLVLENERLRAELASATVAVMDRNILFSENMDLKNRLGHPALNVPRTLALVIARPPALPYDILMIDIGAGSGSKKGDMVTAGGSVYVGTISDVYATTARVTLFSSPGESYQAMLARGTGTSTLAISVSGQGGGSLVSEVPAGSVVRVGDQVLFPSIVPQLVAHVVAVEQKTDTSFKKIFMQLPVNMYELKYVEVYHLPKREE